MLENTKCVKGLGKQFQIDRHMLCVQVCIQMSGKRIFFWEVRVTYVLG